MSEVQIEELVDLARADRRFWESLKDRETDQLNIDGSPKLPSYGMLISELVERKHGPNIFETSALIIRLRFHVRKELGLPV